MMSYRGSRVPTTQSAQHLHLITPSTQHDGKKAGQGKVLLVQYRGEGRENKN